MLDHFTHEAYLELLEVVQSGRANLRFADFAADFAEDAPTDRPADWFLLRHDVDFSLGPALEMARIEAEAGIRATYFLLLGCEHYNLMSEESSDAPRRLIEMGHEVGLHYDVRAMARGPGDDLLSQLEFEAGLLSSLAGEPVRSIAMHLPSIYGEDPFAQGTRFVNAYEQRFTAEIAYYSDSCGAWRDATWEAFRANQIPARLQLLIHPFYWRRLPGSRWDRLAEWLTEMRDGIERHERRVGDVWRNHAGVHEHDRRQDD